MPVTVPIDGKTAKSKLIPLDSITKKITIPIKLVEAYNSFTKTIGISFTKTSRNMPPPIAVRTPEKAIARKFNPNILYAMVAPITVKTPRPTASNLRNKFRCFFKEG